MIRRVSTRRENDMRILPAWLREFVNVTADDRQLAEDLTSAGIAVESVEEENGATVYEMDLTTNRVDAMNHYGVAREASAIYDVELKTGRTEAACRRQGRQRTSLGMTTSGTFPIVIEDAQGCARYTARIIRNVKIGAVARAHRQAARTAGLALHQQRRRRDQLCDQRAWPSHARLRSRLAGRRHDHRAPRARRRSAEDARRR